MLLLCICLQLLFSLSINYLTTKLFCQQLNRAVSGPKNPGVIGDRGSGSLSRESKSNSYNFDKIIQLKKIFSVHLLVNYDFLFIKF